MYRVILKKQFKKDFKLMRCRGKPMVELQRVIEILASGGKLEAKYKDHALAGDYCGCRECHIEPDWLLIYQIRGNVLELVLVRTGTHAELLKR